MPELSAYNSKQSGLDTDSQANAELKKMLGRENDLTSKSLFSRMLTEDQQSNDERGVSSYLKYMAVNAGFGSLLTQ